MEDVSKIEWLGGMFTISAMLSNGWDITHKPKYKNWRDSLNSRESNDYLYFRHPIHKLVGRIRYWPGHPIIGKLDFLTHEKNQRIKPPKYIEHRDYSESDIEPMLKTIISIQKKRPKRRKILPEAEIFELNKAA